MTAYPLISVDVAIIPYLLLLQSDDLNQISKAVRVIERMVNQNTFDDVSQGIASVSVFCSLSLRAMASPNANQGCVFSVFMKINLSNLNGKCIFLYPYQEYAH